MTLQLLLRLHRHSPHSSPLWGSTWHMLGAFLLALPVAQDIHKVNP
nr:MAG TPA: hypothetical protein [Caudoviricetes sp.]